MDPVTLWAGHVTVLKDEHGKIFLRYQKDGDSVPTDFHPQGFFETKALNGLAARLVGS